MSIYPIVLLTNLIIFIAIPVIIGVYVYKDASRHNMNAPLWTLVAVVAPMFVGLIIYLIVRGNYSDLQCPKCAASVSPQYEACPMCGAKLKAACPNCGFGVEPEWIVCPKCAAPLPETQADITPPVKRPDKGLGKILVLVILIPVLLLGLILFSMTSFFTTGGVVHNRVDEMEIGALNF